MNASMKQHQKKCWKTELECMKQVVTKSSYASVAWKNTKKDGKNLIDPYQCRHNNQPTKTKYENRKLHCRTGGQQRSVFVRCGW